MAVKKKLSKKKAPRAKAGRPPQPNKPKLTLINLKVTGKDRAELLARARKYEDGNVSAWLRRAGLSFRPAATSRPVKTAG